NVGDHPRDRAVVPPDKAGPGRRPRVRPGSRAGEFEQLTELGVRDLMRKLEQRLRPLLPRMELHRTSQRHHELVTLQMQLPGEVEGVLSVFEICDRFADKRSATFPRQRRDQAGEEITSLEMADV